MSLIHGHLRNCSIAFAKYIHVHYNYLAHEIFSAGFISNEVRFDQHQPFENLVGGIQTRKKMPSFVSRVNEI